MLLDWNPAYEAREIREKRLEASDRTLDRLLAPLGGLVGRRSLTRLGKLLRQQIPIGAAWQARMAGGGHGDGRGGSVARGFCVDGQRGWIMPRGGAAVVNFGLVTIWLTLDISALG